MAAEAAAGNPPLDWAVAELTLEGEPESGDGYVVERSESGTLVGVVDGLGHGHYAALARKQAAEVLRLNVGDPVRTLFERSHRALAKTRGVAMTLCYFSHQEPSLIWAGVGNVEATLVWKYPKDRRRSESVPLRGGIVGYNLPRIRDATLPISAGDTLVLTTDGIRAGYLEQLPFNLLPRHIADWVLQGFEKGTDDALVLVARYTGDTTDERA